MPPQIPTVVVGGNLNALGVVRSLAREGIEVYVLAATRDCPAAWSRHARFVRSASMQGDAFIDTLLHLASDLNCRPVLILTRDDHVLTISAHREQLHPFYRIELPDAQTVEALSDKLAFDALAAREGFSVPRSCAVRNAGDLERIDELLPPMILKPADKSHALSGASERAVRADTCEQARQLAAAMLAHVPAVIVQEWIEGPDSEIFFTFFCTGHDGLPAGLFTGRKLQSNPPGVGSTAICVPAPEFAETLERETRQFLQRVPYRGLGSLEFKRDVRTGRLLMVEPTVGRTDWQEEIATLCGVNLPVLAYWLALGDVPPSPRPSPPVRRQAWRADCQFQLPEEYRGNTRVIDGHFRWADPMPGVYHYAYERGIQRIYRRARRGFIPVFKRHKRPP